MAKSGETVLQKLDIDTQYIFSDQPDRRRFKIVEIEICGKPHLSMIDEWGVTRSMPED